MARSTISRSIIGLGSAVAVTTFVAVALALSFAAELRAKRAATAAAK